MESLGIEKKLTELEQVVKELESGNCNLDESLKKFEKGVELYQLCRSELIKVEKKIKVLSDKLKEEDIGSV